MEKIQNFLERSRSLAIIQNIKKGLRPPLDRGHFGSRARIRRSTLAHWCVFVQKKQTQHYSPSHVSLPYLRKNDILLPSHSRIFVNPRRGRGREGAPPDRRTPSLLPLQFPIISILHAEGPQIFRPCRSRGSPKHFTRFKFGSHFSLWTGPGEPMPILRHPMDVRKTYANLPEIDLDIAAAHL